MNYTVNEHTFSSDRQMLNFLTAEADSFASKNVAIVAGHYMLMYDDLKEMLVPMIWQDSDNPKVVKMSKNLAGDFPVRTFRYGIKLFMGYEKAGFLPKIALLINDHRFIYPDASHTIDQEKSKILRKLYFHSTDGIPSSFSRLLRRYSVRQNDFFINNDKTRDAQDILPSRSFLFSETYFRTKFDKKIKRKLLLDNNFYALKQKNKTEVYYKSMMVKNSLCLTDRGGCGCSGEVILFFLDLIHRGYRNIILFSPKECVHPVNVGTEVALYLSTKSLIAPYQVNIFIAHNIGGMGEANDFNEYNQILLNKHTIEIL